MTEATRVILKNNAGAYLIPYVDKVATLDGLTATVSELNYCDGVTSNIQTQLNNKQAAGSYLTTTGTASKATADASGNVITSTYEKINKSVTTLATNGTISLTDNSINRISVSDTVTFSLPNVSDSAIFHQILVQLSMASAKTINLGTSYFFDAELPDLSEAGHYDIIYEYNGSNWVCGVLKIGCVN